MAGSYLFIDGGFIDTMIAKAEKEYGLELPRSQLDYEAMARGMQRTFYYDALPSQKKDEPEKVFEAKLAAKLKLFDQINRTPYMHIREGITRSRSPKRNLEQKGVDILLAIDVFKHATLPNMSLAHIMTKDLDFFPLFEALRETQVTVILHCFTSETSDELMSLADVVSPITPSTVLKWFSRGERDKFVDRDIPVGEIPTYPVVKEGTWARHPYLIHRHPTDENLFFRRSAVRGAADRSTRWEYIVWDFEDREQLPIYFDRS